MMGIFNSISAVYQNQLLMCSHTGQSCISSHPYILERSDKTKRYAITGYKINLTAVDHSTFSQQTGHFPQNPVVPIVHI